MVNQFVKSMTATILAVSLAGCAAPPGAERGEVEDTYRQVVDSSLDQYAPEGFEAWRTRNEVQGAVTLSSYRDYTAGLGSDADAYTGDARVRLLGGRREERRLTLHPAYRASDLAALDPASRTRLDSLIGSLKGKPGLRIQVDGHTDDQPLSAATSTEYGDNAGLSQARAERVASHLRDALGLGAETVTVMGFGASRPLSGDTSPAARARNRRVEIVARFESPAASQTELIGDIPEGFTPWWSPYIATTIRTRTEPTETTMDGLFLSAIRHSNQIRVFSDIPLIRETAILEAEGRFDPHVFAEARYNKVDEPVGSTLKTGGPSNFEEREWRFKVGTRKQTWSGGELEVAQRVGTVDNNSLFFVPSDQAQTRLQMSFTQPLLNRAGFEYNLSTLSIAKLDRDIAQDEFQRQVESHLIEVARAYWGLYLERTSLMIKTRLATEAEQMLEEFQARRGVDTLESQIIRARAALAARRADTVRAGLAVRNAEAKILALVNDPNMRLVDTLELVTRTDPVLGVRSMEPRQAAEHALKNRPEIGQAMKQLRAGVIRTKMSKQELLPVLDLIVETSFDGLQGRDRVGEALNTQFDGGPSYGVGLLLDIPLGNRTARARHERRRLEVRQLTNQLRTTIDTLLLEVQVSVREVNTGHRDMVARYHEMEARRSALDSLTERQVLVSDSGVRSLYLEELLDAQEAQAQAEQEFANAMVTYNVALVNLDRAMGVLMQSREITVTRNEGDLGDMPRLELNRP